MIYKSNKTGFGLVELMVALAIVGLLWGGLKYFRQYATESKKSVGGAVEARQQTEAVKLMIEAHYASTTLGE